MREIHRAGTASRVDLARATGLSTQSLTRITKDLLDRGYVVEGERRFGGRGQPAILLSIAPGRFISFGLVFEHDRITCIAMEMGGEEIFRLRRRGRFNAAGDAVAAAAKMLSDAIPQVPDESVVLGLGISVSGFFFDGGAARVVSRNDPEGWRATDLRQVFEDEFNMPVTVENDGSVAAVGQALSGVATGLDDFFLVLMTKGVGGGFVHDGRLVRGRLGNAGELAALMPVDAAAIRPSEESLDAFLKARWGASPTAAQIDAALRAGDTAIDDWLEQATAVLEPALSAVTALLDPGAIVFAGRLPVSIREALARRVVITGPSFAGIDAPVPDILIDPKTDCLAVGAASLPVLSFLRQA